MRKQFGLLIASVCLIASVATAQTKQKKISGVARCEKAEPQHTLQVDGRPNHSFTISHTKCSWTKPYEIEGIKAQTCWITSFSESSGSTSRYRGYYTDTMANGDKTYYEMEGTVASKDGIVASADEKWTLIRGTGKMKGITARGACKATGNPDGSTTWTCEGEYELPK